MYVLVLLEHREWLLTIYDIVAHDLVYDLCRKANLEDKTLLELLTQSDEVKAAGLSHEELAKLCDPGNYLGLSEAMVDRVLEGAK